MGKIKDKRGKGKDKKGKIKDKNFRTLSALISVCL